MSTFALAAGAAAMLAGAGVASAREIDPPAVEGYVAAAGSDLTGAQAAQVSPTITVEPHDGLTNGHTVTVTVTGSGFTPNNAIGVSECNDRFVDWSGCEFSTAKIANSDANGAFTMTYAVVDTINGDHSCVPTGCLIGAANRSSETSIELTKRMKRTAILGEAEIRWSSLNHRCSCGAPAATIWVVKTWR